MAKREGGAEAREVVGRGAGGKGWCTSYLVDTAVLSVGVEERDERLSLDDRSAQLNHAVARLAVGR